ncbi:hypothetical protein MN032_02785 [Agromyces atrinae]|uniref:hypothetical protein n=1 Tax=Agromyces atrinae TaxID=592376 RepID=UPI001F578841|nr:hypothetical protein [Agromyces atrinae]MCI2956608.1 hypothetical protein [Agromyces atrinae]
MEFWSAAVLAAGLAIAPIGAAHDAPAAVAAAAEASASIAVTAPAGTTEAWIDIDDTALTLSDVRLEVTDGSGWRNVPLSATAFGVGAVTGAAEGSFEARVTSTVATDADVAISFAAAGELLDESSVRLDLVPGEIAPSPTPVAPADPDDSATAGSSRDALTSTGIPALSIAALALLVAAAGAILVALRRQAVKR